MGDQLQTMREEFGKLIHDIPPLERLLTSFFFSPDTCFRIRLFNAVYATVVLISHMISFFWNGYFFAFYTHLSYTFLTIHFWIMAYLSYIYMKCVKENKELPPLLSERNRMSKFVWILHAIMFPSAAGIDIVYWAVLFRPNPGSLVWTNFHVHGINFLQYLAELSCGQLDLEWRHFTYVFTFLIVYLIYMFIIHFTTDQWVYEVLAFDFPGQWIFYFGILLVFVIGFFCCRRIIRWRNNYASQRGLNNRVFKVNDTNAENLRKDGDIELQVSTANRNTGTDA